jgi:hypothetical protein
MKQELADEHIRQNMEPKKQTLLQEVPSHATLLPLLCTPCSGLPLPLFSATMSYHHSFLSSFFEERQPMVLEGSGEGYAWGTCFRKVLEIKLELSMI